MFTIVVFWQEEKLNTKMNGYFTKQENLEVFYLNECRNQETAIQELLQRIGECVRSREYWRIFLVDNYLYQCLAYHKTNKQSSCCCCTDYCMKREQTCEKAECGKGRNPFSGSAKMSNAKNKEHVKNLLELIKKIENPKSTEWIKPIDVFVIMVRDGEFQCKYEISVPNFKEEYWKVSEEFPKRCRYLVYDMLHYGKKLYERELYWLYSLIIFLGRNELCTDQFLRGYMYRIEVTYSQKKYHEYLLSVYSDVEREQMQWNDFGEEDIKKSYIDPYPLIVHSRGVEVKYDLKIKMREEKIEKIEEEMMNIIEEIFSSSSKEYKEQWEKLRMQVSNDAGENADIYEQDRRKYERQLYDRDFIEKQGTIEIDEIGMDKEHVKKELKKQFDEYKKIEKNKWNILEVILYVAFFFCGNLYLVGKLEMDFSLCYSIFFGGLIVVVMILENYWKKGYILRRIRRWYRFLDKQQYLLDERRNEFMKISRNTMLYWKRKHACNKKKEEKAKMWEMQLLQKREKKELKENMEILLKIEEGNVTGLEETGVTKEALENIFIGSRRAGYAVPFISRVRFVRTEERR